VVRVVSSGEGQVGESGVLAPLQVGGSEIGREAFAFFLKGGDVVTGMGRRSVWGGVGWTRAESPPRNPTRRGKN
jgi:hypothetical protein